MRTFYIHRDPVLDLFGTGGYYALNPAKGRTLTVRSEGPQTIVEFSHIDRRLVYDEMFGYMWYNAVEGPESEEELLV